MFWSAVNYLKSFFNKSEQVIEPKGWLPEWSVFIESFYANNALMFASFSSVKDITVLRPDWHLLTKEQQLKVIVTFIKAICLFESSYNPLSYSVDAGTIGRKETYSVGLMQISVIDQINHKIFLEYHYEDLFKPINNLNLGLRVLDKQLIKTHKLFLSRGESCYWSTISYGYKGSKIDQICKIVQKVTF